MEKQLSKKKKIYHRKYTILALLLWSFTGTTMISASYAIEATNTIPEDIKNFLNCSVMQCTQTLLFTSPSGRQFIKLTIPNRPPVILAFYTDDNNRIWPSLIDVKNRKEKPFIYIKRLGTDDYEAINPDTIQTKKQLIPPKNIMYPPNDMPRLTKNDPTFDLLSQDQTQLKKPQYIKPKHRPASQKIDSNNTVSTTEDKSDVKQAHIKKHSNVHVANDDGYPEDNHNDYHDQDNIEIPQKSPSPTWLDYCPSSTTLCIGSITALGIWLIYVGRQSWLGDAYLAKGLWSDWRSPEPYSVLLMVEPENLSEFLIEDITVTYFDDPDPIGRFLTDIQAEEDELIDWLHIRGVIERSFVIPTSSLWDTIEHRIELLRHMRKAVYYWRAQQIKTQRIC